MGWRRGARRVGGKNSPRSQTRSRPWEMESEGCRDGRRGWSSPKSVDKRELRTAYKLPTSSRGVRGLSCGAGV